MYLVRKTGRKCMNVDKYCLIMEFPFTRLQIILGLWCHGMIEKVFPTFDDVFRTYLMQGSSFVYVFSKLNSSIEKCILSWVCLHVVCLGLGLQFSWASKSKSLSWTEDPVLWNQHVTKLNLTCAFQLTNSIPDRRTKSLVRIAKICDGSLNYQQDRTANPANPPGIDIFSWIHEDNFEKVWIDI